MLRKKVEDGDGARMGMLHTSDEEEDEQQQDPAGSDPATKTPKKQHSNRSFKPASAVLDSVRRKYRKFRESLDDGGFSSEQFQEPEARIPFRAITLAVFLLLAGSAALTLSLLSLAGHVSAIPNEGPAVLMALGLLMFVPGFYHVRIAVYAFRQYPGYSFDDIPDFD